jgi:type VI secretion system protein ImpG
MSDQGDQDGFVRTYRAELEALRTEGEAFAERFPKIAGRLRLGDDANPDPHVERLVESFAFLASRVQTKLNDDHPELSDAMLELLYPHLTRPIPSMSVVEVEPDPGVSMPAAGVSIVRGTTFLSRPIDGEPLTFTSSADLTLRPIRVTGATVGLPSVEERRDHPKARATLSLELQSEGEHSFPDLAIDKLRFFLKGDVGVTGDLYELLAADVMQIGVGDQVVPLDCLRPMGFDDDEAMLSCPRRSFTGYRFLQEYFAFPAKFHFFELSGLNAAAISGKKLELRFVLRREPRVPETSIEAANFALNCVPLVNLFEVGADPIMLQPFVSEYDVVPDKRHPLMYEVYGIEELSATVQGGGDRQTYLPFFSLHGGAGADQDGVYWQARRRASRRKADDGTEVSVSLVCLNLDRAPVDGGTLHIRLQCTNRDVPFRSGKWGTDEDFRPEGVSGISVVRCVHRPTRTLRPPLRGAAQWRLISQLSLNYLSLVREGRTALREILRIHDVADSAASAREVEGLLDVQCEAAVSWMQNEFGSGFVRGLHTTVKLDREAFVGSSMVLFASVLERFLALYSAINSFSELSLETAQDEGEVLRWPPRSGERVLL